MKKINIKDNLINILVILIVMQPIFDMDYLISAPFDALNIPRISTIIRFIVLPLIILGLFLNNYKEQKKMLTLGISYGLISMIYFVVHHLNSIELITIMSLPSNFEYSMFYELVYILTLIMPILIVFVLFKNKISEKVFKISVVASSTIISIPIFLSNIFVFGMSTYEGYTPSNIFTWFTNGYIDVMPRTLSTKFFFPEGNTIGILLFALLPLLYYFLLHEKNKTNKILLGLLCVIHNLSMIILGTRVSTYGVALLGAVVIVVHLFLVFIKKENFKIGYYLFIGFNILYGVLIIPYTPMYQQQVYYENKDSVIYENDELMNEYREELEEIRLIEDIDIKNNAYIELFEKSELFVSATPKDYYLSWYPYTYDPEFWINFIYNYDISERVDGRQFQEIFIAYKKENLTIKDELLGMGYTTYMNGSILLERDFIQQIHTLGYIGFTIFLLPWILIYVILGLIVLKNFKELFSFKTCMLMLSIASILGNAYLSAHTMDEFTTSLWLALLVSIMLNSCMNKKN